MTRIAWLLFALSAALNVVLLVGRARAGSAPPPPAASQSAAAPQMEHEREREARPAPAPPPLFGAVTGAPPSAARPSLAEVGYAEQQGALCELARDHLRREWQKERERITQSLIADLRSPAQQEANLQQELARYSSLLDLRPPAREAFADRLRAQRGARVQSLLASVEGETPNYAGALTAARGLFSDEDRLAREYAGDNGALLMRASELDSRTAILAILSAFADAPWDSSITW